MTNLDIWRAHGPSFSEVLYEGDLPGCCRRAARGAGDCFECPSCGAAWIRGEQPHTITPEEQIRNVAQILMKYTEVERHYNGRGKSPTYASDRVAIRDTGRQLAEMVLAHLDGALESKSIIKETPF